MKNDKEVTRAQSSESFERDRIRAKNRDEINKQSVINLKTNPEPTGQKFPRGSFVKIIDDLGEHRPHFPKGTYAKVEYTYAHAFPQFCTGTSGASRYSLLVWVKDSRGLYYWSSTAWYDEEDLLPISSKALIQYLEDEIKTARSNPDVT